MNRQDRQHLLAEQHFLREQLADLPASATLTRMSDEARLKAIETQFAEYPFDEHEPALVRLTFNGKPVIGSQGIFAEFGMKAVNCFTEAVTIGTEHHIVPDIMLFLNGLPVVVIECKSPKVKELIPEAIDQMLRYSEQRGAKGEGDK